MKHILTKIKSSYEKLSPSKKVQLILASIATTILMIAAPTSAWFMHQRKVATVAKINSPAKLTLKSGAHEDIIQFQMSGINVGNGTAGYKDFVFSVEGEDKSDYYIQLAHTTNINFSYDIYKAHTDDINGTVSYIMNDANRTEVKYLIDATPITGSYVNGTVDSGKTIGNKLYNDPSYYDDSEDASKSDKRQKNAEPLYWQSSATVDGKAAGYNEYNTAYQTENPRAFLNYYVIRVSWGANQVTNDKETDLVYITVELG